MFSRTLALSPIYTTCGLDKSKHVCFRAPHQKKIACLTLMTVRKKTGDELCEHSPEPLKQSLSNRLLVKVGLSMEAISARRALLEYTGESTVILSLTM